MVSNLAEQLDPYSVPASEVKQSPLQWCSISLSEVIERGKRLEASVFEVEGKHAKQIISECIYGSVPICGENGLATAYTCARFKRVWVEKSEFPIFQPSTILDVKPMPDGFISSKTHTNIDDLRVKKGQILLTCSGTVGNVTYVSKALDNKIFSHDLLRITCKNIHDSGYVYAYLKSKTGNTILQTSNYGAVITHIEAEHLIKTNIPNPPDMLKKKINDLIVKSYLLRDESNEMIDLATQLMIDELKLPEINDFNVKTLKKEANVDTFSVKLSASNKRFDASFHMPIVDAIVEHLKNNADEVTTVGDNRISKEITLPGRFKRIYVDEGYGRVFIGGRQLFELDPSNKKYLSLVQHGDRIAKQLELYENMTLITCSGTIGKVTLVPKHWEKWTANQHIIRVVPASSDIAGYISIFLSSEYAYPLIVHYTYGSVVDEIDDSHVSQVSIPLLKNREVQKKINDLAIEANAKRYEAYQLEKQAMKIMNEDVIFRRKLD